MIELTSVTKQYRLGVLGSKRLTAVSDVSFSVPERCMTSLIGESGSGKTTVGRMILRLLAPTSGTVSFRGDGGGAATERGRRDYYRRVQGVFQDPFSSFNPVFKADRVFEMIKGEFFQGAPRSEWDGRVEASLLGVGLQPADVLGKYAHQLSGGQLQRFLLARALLLDASFLVADEVISMLDASTRIDILNLFADLKARGLSILFITHDLNLGYYASDETLIMYRGRLVEAGRTEAVFGNPLHPYTRALLESVPRLDEKWKPMSSRGCRGGAPDAAECPFFDRCPERAPSCARQELVEVEPGHRVACSRASTGIPVT